MAGPDNEQVTRRSRGREVSALTRTAASAAAPQNDNTRRTKAANKRAAMDDSSIRAAGPAPVPHAKKRAALTNLTNQSNVLPRQSTQANKSQVPVQGSVATGKSRATHPIVPEKEVQDVVEVSQSGELYPVGSCVTNSSVTFENDENSAIELVLDTVEKNSTTQFVNQTNLTDSKTVASLERKTQHSLYISRESKPRVRQGGLFPDITVENEGWSCKSYTDIDNHKDPQMCSAYAADIYEHLRVAELKRRPIATFMETVQQDINASMRGILVDWLVEVAEEYKLVPDTLYLTVSYIDRFLSGNVVTRQRLQLLGVACMLVASKYEEICAPQVEEFCYITDNTYNREEVLEMERIVLKHLHFELTGPTTKSFLRRFVRAAQAGQKTPTLQLEFLGNYLAELTLLEYNFLQYLPSMVAAAAVFLAKVTLNPSCTPWNLTLQHYTGYNPSELKGCVKAIHDLQKNTKNCTLPAIREKYRQHKFKCVATLAPLESIPNEYFEDLK